MEGITKEEDDGKSNPTPISKSVGSPVKIKSISIDLVSANDKNQIGKCEHFSIRGYVSAVRARDRNLCLPFSLDDNHNKSEEEMYMLPPLHVPQFRWWQCQNCMQVTCEEDAAKEKNTDIYCFKKDLKTIGTWSVPSPHNDASVMPSNSKEVVEVDNLKGKTFNVDMSTYVNKNKYHPPYGDEDKENNEDVHTTVTATNASGYTATPGISRLDIIPRTTKLYPMQGAYTNISVPFESKRAPATKYCFLGNPESDNNLKSAVKSSAEISETGKENSPDSQTIKIMTSCCSSDVVCVHDLELHSVKRYTNRHPSLESDECDNVSSGNAENLVESDLQYHAHESSVPRRRKTPKTRLLTELLHENGHARTDHIKKKDYPSIAISDPSNGIDKLSVPKVQVAVQGNASKGVVSQYRKRRLPHDEEWRPLEVSAPENVNKKSCTHKGIGKTTTKVANSESNRDAFGGIIIKTGTGSHSLEHGIGRNLMNDHKERRTTPVSERCMVSRESMPIEFPVRNRHTSDCHAADSILSSSVKNALEGRAMHPSHFPAQRIARTPISGKKSKMLHIDNGNTFGITLNNGSLKEDLLTQKGKEVIPNRSLTVPFQSAEVASADKGLDLSLHSYTAKKFDRKYIPQVEDELVPLGTLHEGTLKENRYVRKNAETKSVQSSGFFTNPWSDTCHLKGVRLDPGSKKATYRMDFLNEKNQVQDRGSSMLKHVDIPGTSYPGKHFGLKEYSSVGNDHSAQRANHKYEDGTLDDIPMEIVELMAKNQYERCLNDAKDTKSRLETINNARNGQMIEFNKVYGNMEFRLLQDEQMHKRKTRAKNGENAIITTGDYVGPSMEKLFDYFPYGDKMHFSRSQLEQPNVLPGFIAFPRCRERSNGVQLSAPSSSRHTMAQNCKMNGELMGLKSSPFGFKPLGACNTCLSVSDQGKEATHVMPSMISNNAFGFDVSPKPMVQSSCKETLSNCSRNMHKSNTNGVCDPKFLDLNTTLEKQDRVFGSQDYTTSCKHNGNEVHQKMMGSLDVYSNDTIPALHLLSLMDAGVRSSNPVNRGGTKELLKEPSASRNHHPKEFPWMNMGVYRTGNASKPLAYDYYGKRRLTENPRECLPAAPIVSAPLLHREQSFQMAPGIIGQASFKCLPKKKHKSDDLFTQNKISGPQKSGGGLVLHHGIQNTQKIPSGATNSVLFPCRTHTIENITKKQKLESHISEAVVTRKNPKNEICSINRNPADFTIPHAENEYMILGEDIKFRNRKRSTKSVSVDLDGHNKRQRDMKLPAARGRGRGRGRIP